LRRYTNEGSTTEQQLLDFIYTLTYLLDALYADIVDDTTQLSRVPAELPGAGPACRRQRRRYSAQLNAAHVAAA
jgi:hypothetical protein